MKMTELKMYEAPKMEVVEVELEMMLAASGDKQEGGPLLQKKWKDEDIYED